MFDTTENNGTILSVLPPTNSIGLWINHFMNKCPIFTTGEIQFIILIADLLK